MQFFRHQGIKLTFIIVLFLIFQNGIPDLALCTGNTENLSNAIPVKENLHPTTTIWDYTNILKSVDSLINLRGKEDVWNFQLDLYRSRGAVCNYVIITNPHDTDDDLDENIKWPFISMSAALLGAFRRALVQTGEYTANKEILLELNRAQEPLGEVYSEARPYFEKVKKDSYFAVKYLLDHQHTPEYMALVGGAFALPDYYFDIHTKYKYWDQVLHYVPSMSAYANLSSDLPTNISVREDLGIGRVIGHSILSRKCSVEGFI
jgi:hypothetical protein